MDRRKIEENVFKILMIASSVIIFLSLAHIVMTVIARGLPSLTMAMFTETPKGGYYLGKEGGILNAIVGSLYVAGGATILAIAISLPVVLYINVYRRRESRLALLARFSFDVLWGIPSIVYGAFGFMVMLFFGLKASLLGGLIALTLLMFPIMSRAMDEVVRMVPHELLETSYSLGATRLEAAFSVVVRQALPGILTAILIAFGRGIGDAASVLFTAGFSNYIPYSLFQPVATLPLAIFYQLGTPVPEVQGRAYASALILTAIILIISILSRVLTKRFTSHVIK